MSNFDRVENRGVRNDRVENRGVTDDRQQLIAELEPEYKCPLTWADGPVRNAYRKVTDKCCLVIFLLVLLSMIATAIYALTKADPMGLEKVYDSSGNICGAGATADYPILYLQTFQAPFRSVCVKDCPHFDYNQIKYNSTGVSTYPNGTDIPLLDVKQFNKLYGNLSRTNSIDINEDEAFAYNKEWVNGYFTEQQWNDYLNRYRVDCHPNDQFASCQYFPHQFYIYDSYNVMNTVCAPLNPKSGLIFNRVSAKFDNGSVGDMAYALPLFGWTALTAIGLSLIFLIVITCCTTLITWFLLVLLALAFFTVGSLIVVSYTHTGPLNDSWNTLRIKYLDYLISHKPEMITLAVVCFLLGLLTLYLMFKYRRYINVAIPLITVASRSSLKNGMLLLLSTLILALQIGVFFLECYIILKLYTTGEEVKERKQGSPFVSYTLDDGQKFMIALHAFGTYWLITTLNNFNDFICSAVSVNYYWTTQIENMRIFCHTLGHHVGSIAWSIILLPILLVKLTFGWIDFLTSSDHPNALQTFTRKILCCCFWFYERFIDVVSENYFAITYLGSEDFWPANKRYYYLSEKYYDQSSTISLVGNLFGMAGKLLITIATVAVGYSIYKGTIEYQQNIDNVGLLFVVIALIGFFLGSLFVNLFATTYEAIVVCYLVELNIYDTSGRAISKAVPEVRDVMEEMRAERNAGYDRL